LTFVGVPINEVGADENGRHDEEDQSTQ